MAAVMVRQTVLILLRKRLSWSWDQVLPGAGMRTVHLREKWFSNTAMSLHLCICMYTLTWRYAGLCSVTHLRLFLRPWTVEFWNPYGYDCDLTRVCWNEDLLACLRSGEPGRELGLSQEACHTLAVLTHGQMKSLLLCAVRWLVKMVVNDRLWQSSLDVPLGRGCYATLRVSLARKRGWPKLLTFSERRKQDCRVWAASIWWTSRPWSHLG